MSADPVVFELALRWLVRLVGAYLEVLEVLEGRKRWCVVCADNADVLPLLPDKSVAHVITDPPYEADAHVGARRQTREHTVVEHQIDFAPITEIQRGFIATRTVALSKGWVLAFCQVEAVERWRSVLTAAGAKWRRAAAWVKPDCAPQFNGNGWAQGFECICAAWAGSGRSEWNGHGRRGVFEHGVNNFGRLTSGREHPTMKPVPLMLELVELFTDPDELILDPFAGSGTTGVAGVELTEHYAEVAANRLRTVERGYRDDGQQGAFDLEEGLA